MMENDFWKVCAALDNPKRLALLRLLVESSSNDPCVGEIAEKVGLSVGVTSLYLKQLREAGLVSSACADRRIYYRAFPTDARGETVVAAFRRFFAGRPTEERLFDLLKVVRALAHRRRNAYLRFLSDRPGCGIPETAKRLGMPPATLDRLFGQLARARLVDATGAVTCPRREPKTSFFGKPSPEDENGESTPSAKHAIAIEYSYTT